MSQTQVYTWTGRLANGTAVGEGTHTLQLRAYEAPNGFNNGQLRTYTTTVTIDTTPPAPVQNLKFDLGRPRQGNDPGEPDVLSWDAVSDNSPGGFRYLVYHPKTRSPPSPRSRRAS